MKTAELACSDAVKDVIAPKLEATVTAVLGEKHGGWFEFQIDATTHSPVLFFHDPTGLSTSSSTTKTEDGGLPQVPHVAIPASFGS
jgi:hypothetical protein